MEPLQWIFVVTALTLVFIVFAINPLQVAIEEATQNNAQLQAQRIASAINLMLTAPDGTTYSLEMPKARCKLTVAQNFTRLTIIQLNGADISHTASLISTDAAIKGGEFSCGRRMQLSREKASNELEILVK